MKKLVLTAAATAFLIPLAAQAQIRLEGGGPAPTVNRAAPEGGYASYGQCNSALMRERNARRDGHPTMSASEYNRNFRQRYECRPVGPNGGYYVVVNN